MQLRIEVSCDYVCEPIVGMAGKVIAVELLTRFSSASFSRPVSPSNFLKTLSVGTKGLLLVDQLQKIMEYATFFNEQDLCVSVNIDFDMARFFIKNADALEMIKSMPFLRLEINERFPNLDDGNKNPLLSELAKYCPLWLDDFGSGNANLAAVTSGIFELVKLDKAFYWEEGRKTTFPILIRNIQRYCQGVIVEGVENKEQEQQLRNSGILAMQGFLWRSIPFGETLKIN